MDFSSSNTALWNPVVQMGIIAMLILLSNVLRRKVKWIRKSLTPTAVLAGFILLLLRYTGLFPVVDVAFLEMLTYHGLALGFIALSLRAPEKASEMKSAGGSKCGALIVSTYMVQAIVGMVISLVLSYTFMPELFQASGILLPMAYGQGPGQANNVGTTYEALGMVGGRSFGLSLAAAGYLCACIVGVIYLNIWHRRGRIKKREETGSASSEVSVHVFQDADEMPIAESMDRFSMQTALVVFVYLITFMITKGIVMLLNLVSPGVAATVSTLLWGFNFIIGSLLATACRVVLQKLRKYRVMEHQYQNNYLLSRISGVAFDFMIVAGIASIQIEDLSGYLLPFVLMAILGGVVTFFYLLFICKKMFPEYAYEAFFAMFGMLTGTISSGVLLLRELDPDLKTPASGDLVTGSSFGIIFGAPVLLLVSFAPKNALTAFLTLGFVCLYLALLLAFIFWKRKKKIVFNTVKENEND